MSHAAALHRIYDLPWSSAEEQERNFRRVLKISAIALLVIGLIVPWLPVLERDPQQVPEVPTRLARLVLERQAPPPPPPPVVREEAEPVPQPEPEPVIVEQRAAEPEPPPVVAPATPELPPVDRVAEARERARGAGLLPFAEELAALRTPDTLQSLGDTGTSGTVDGPAVVAERSLITSRAGAASGGINTAQLSRDTGGAGLAERAVTQVESPVAGGESTSAAVARVGDSNRASRSREEIEQVFDRNKSAIHALYNRALRQNPALEGKVVLRLTIAPSGEVTDCEIVSSELGDPDLEQRLVQRVLLFRFEAREVEPITTTKPIDFFPA
jgi:periplasmic protein TonB